MSDPLSIGIIGLGFIGRTHLAAVLDAQRDGQPVRLHALCDRDPARLTPGHAAAGNLPGSPADLAFDPAAVRTFADPRDLLADPALDAVIIATHTDTHVDLGHAAIAAGKHLLIEKPVALRAAEVRRLADAARAARPGLVAMPAMCMRFWPGWTWLKDAIARSDFGRVRSATFQRLGCPPAWSPFYADLARSGGPLFDLHVHDADFIRYALGQPRRVSSAGSVHHLASLYHLDAPAGQTPPLILAEGGLDHTPAFPFRMRFVVAFEHATADFDLTRSPQLLLHRAGRSEPIDLPAGSAFDAQVRHFIRGAAGLEPGPPRATLDDAVMTTALLEAEARSLATGRPVDL